MVCSQRFLKLIHIIAQESLVQKYLCADLKFINIRSWIQLIPTSIHNITTSIHNIKTLIHNIQTWIHNIQNWIHIVEQHCQEICKRRFEVHKYLKLDSAGLVNLCRGDGLSPHSLVIWFSNGHTCMYYVDSAHIIPFLLLHRCVKDRQSGVLP